jgi:hypothetical protein
LLEVAQLAHEHSVAEMEIGGGGVESGFDAEGAPGFERIFEALAKVADADDFGGAFLEQVELLVNGWEGGHVDYKYTVPSLIFSGQCSPHSLGRGPLARAIIISMSYRNSIIAALIASNGAANVAATARAAAAAA